MDEETIEEKQSWHRNPSFNREESKALTNLIDKYKTTILNKSNCSAANHAKEVTWEKIAQLFNNLGFYHHRSADCLKTKWENLKKHARKSTKSIFDEKHMDYDELDNKIVSMLLEAENFTSLVEVPPDIDEKLNESEEQKDLKDSKFVWDESKDRQSDDSTDGDHKNKRNRSLNFSPVECSILLKCVRKEKKYIFSKDSTSKAMRQKDQAWSRIANSFNSISQQKRSKKVLRTKFDNMKKSTKTVDFKGVIKKNRKLEKFDNSNCIKVEVEPASEDNMDSDMDDVNDEIKSVQIELNHNSQNTNNVVADPLSTILNGDSGIDPGFWSQPENDEISKLKLQLLNYQMETAKLERKRIEDAMQADAAARDARATEMALRLRSARLETIAAEMRLPPTHPALHYTPQETRAQEYLHQYHQT